MSIRPELDMNHRIQMGVYAVLEDMGMLGKKVRKLSGTAIGLLASLVTNLTLLGALVNTYLRNDYFRVWADSAMDSIVRGAIGFGIVLGLLVHVVFLHDKLTRKEKRNK